METIRASAALDRSCAITLRDPHFQDLLFHSSIDLPHWLEIMDLVELPSHVWARVGSSCQDVASFWALSSSDIAMHALRNDPDLIMWRHGQAKKDTTARILNIQAKLEGFRGDEMRMAEEERVSKAGYDALVEAEQVFEREFMTIKAESATLKMSKYDLEMIRPTSNHSTKLCQDIEAELAEMKERGEEIRTRGHWWRANKKREAALAERLELSRVLTLQLVATKLVAKNMESRIPLENQRMAVLQGMDERIDLYKGMKMRMVAEKRVTERADRWRERRERRSKDERAAEKRFNRLSAFVFADAVLCLFFFSHQG